MKGRQGELSDRKTLKSLSDNFRIFDVEEVPGEIFERKSVSDDDRDWLTKIIHSALVH